MSTLDHMPFTQKVLKEKGIKPDDLVKSLEIIVERAPGQKCPRCWNYHTVIGNPMEVCDRCVVAITSSLDWLVAEGRWTQADADEWRGLVREMVNRWKAKT